MRKLPLLAILCFAAALAPVPARAVDAIEASSSVALSMDPGFEGLYKYSIVVTWSLDRHDLGHLDLFLDLAVFGDTCNGGAVRFPSPAGTSTGEDALGAPCVLPYRGEFLCKTDPSIPFTALGATVKFEPEEEGCQTAESGSGQFVFYSSVGPGLASYRANAVAIKHGREVDFGGLFGPAPLRPQGAPQPETSPVVINEFLVLPHGSDREFIELLNVSGGPVDLDGWSIWVFSPIGDVVSISTFQPGDSLFPGGYLARRDSSFYQTCYTCDYYYRRGAPQAPLSAEQAAGETDILFDAGGVILLRDAGGAVIDRVGYGVAGAAPISCPLVIPAGRQPPPGFGPAPPPENPGSLGPEPVNPGVVGAEPETVSTSTSRIPDGTDTDNDGADFSIASPTPDATNVGTTPDLGSSIRVNAVFVFPENGDADPENESVEFYNPTAQTKDIRDYHLSDGFLIQPVFPAGAAVPLEPAQKYKVIHGLNGTISFEFEEEDRIELYEPRPEGLVRIDQMGWSRTPAFFPDSCLMRLPDGAGPSGGWNWDTSGGFVTLFYVDACGLSAPDVGVAGGAGAGAALAGPRPSPARGTARFEFVVGQGQGARAPARVALYDVAGRRLRVLAEGSYAPGRYVATWDGATDDGRRAAAGVYFVRLFVSGCAVGEPRAVVWLRD